MSDLIRFGVSIDSKLLDKFDTRNDKKGYENRSEAIRDLIRDCLVEEDIEANKDTIVGVVSLVYNHHKLDLPKKLTDEQHKNHSMFLSTLHIHLDSHNCLEVLLLKGPGDEVKKMADALISTKGIKHGKLTITTTGSELE